MANSDVYPVGILVMGTQLRLLGSKATLEEKRVFSHQVGPYAYNLMRFAQADRIVPFVIVSHDAVIHVDSIHAFGPALIERIVFGATVVYDKLATTESDGKLFVCPHRILEVAHPLHVQLRCLPELFMLAGRNPHEPSTLTSDEIALMQSHDSADCDDCNAFRKTVGLDP